MKSRILAASFLPILVIIILGACSGGGEKQMEESAGMTAHKTAVAVLHPTEGNDVQGIVKFTEVAGGVEVVADIDGLTPGRHGFHIHEFGDCSALDATSAGGHFNPLDMEHGAPTDEQRHLGDLGNITADNEGHAHFEWTDGMLALNGPNSIIGRAVIVHAGEDDLQTQPTGNAGPRVACGVIGIAKYKGVE
jgi:Cu-Zn family superoxide dismutase